MKAPKGDGGAPLGQHLANAGLLLFSVSLHAQSQQLEISLAIVGRWLAGVHNFHRKDRAPSVSLRCAGLAVFCGAWLCLSFPRSLRYVAKLQSAGVIFLFYLIRADGHETHGGHAGRLDDLSGVAGTLYSVSISCAVREIVRRIDLPGKSVATASGPRGDAIWRIDKRRVYSVADIAPA